MSTSKGYDDYRNINQKIFIVNAANSHSELLNSDQNSVTNDLDTFLAHLELYLTPQLPASPSKASGKVYRIVAPTYTVTNITALWIVNTLLTCFFQGGNRVSSQSVLLQSNHKDRLKDILVGCLVASITIAENKNNYSDTTNNKCDNADNDRTTYVLLTKTTIELLISIVNQHAGNEQWFGQDKALTSIIMRVLQTFSDNQNFDAYILSRSVQYLDNIAMSSAVHLAIDTSALEIMVNLCDQLLSSNSEDLLSSILSMIHNVFQNGAKHAFFPFLSKLHSLHLLSCLLHILQSPIAAEDISVAEAALTLLSLLIELFGPHALKLHCEAKSAAFIMTGSEGFHNIISDLVDLRIEPMLIDIIRLYLPYSISVVSAAIHVIAVLAPYYEEHPALLHSPNFGDSRGLTMLLTEWLPAHRVDEAALAADYLCILYHWSNNLHRTMEKLYLLHAEAVKTPSGSAQNTTRLDPHTASTQRRKSSLYIMNTSTNSSDNELTISPALIAQFSQHTAGKGSILVPSVRNSFISVNTTTVSNTNFNSGMSITGHDTVLLEKRKRKRQKSGMVVLDKDGLIVNSPVREYEPFSLLGYLHRLVPGVIALVNTEGEQTIEEYKDGNSSTALVATNNNNTASSNSSNSNSNGDNTENTLMALLLKSTLVLCHDFQRLSRRVAEYTLRVLYRIAHTSPLAWMAVLQAGGVGQIVQCVKAHGRVRSFTTTNSASNGTNNSNSKTASSVHENMIVEQVSSSELVFAEVASAVLARSIASVDVARYARYFIVDLQVMEVISQYLLSSYAHISRKLLGHGSTTWITLCEHRTASLASQRMDVSACESSVSLLRHYLAKYELASANVFVIQEENEELRDIQAAIRVCLVWIDRIVSFERNRPKLVELSLTGSLQQLLRHQYPFVPTIDNTNSADIHADDINRMDIMIRPTTKSTTVPEENISSSSSANKDDAMVILTLQIIRGLCHGVHAGNILGAGNHQNSTVEEQAMRQMVKQGVIPVILQILTTSVGSNTTNNGNNSSVIYEDYSNNNQYYVREIVLLAVTILTIFASKHKLQLGESGSCQVLHQLLVYEVRTSSANHNNGGGGGDSIDETLSEALCHICTAIYNLSTQCEENKRCFIALQTLTLLQQLSRAPYCSAMCKNELKDAINVLRF